MRYENQVPFRGDLGRAFDLAIASLTSLGFRIVEKTATSVAFEGPGMVNTRQSPLTGASAIQLSAAGPDLRLEADLGGVAGMARFLYVFPFLLGAILLGVFALVFARMGAFWIAAVAVGGAISPWLVLSPLMARWVRVRTTRALDVLLENAAAAA
jgi:hypothetical protein